MSVNRWVEDRLNGEVWLVSGDDEILVRLKRFWRSWVYGSREFLTLDAAKRAALNALSVTTPEPKP